MRRSEYETLLAFEALPFACGGVLPEDVPPFTPSPVECHQCAHHSFAPCGEDDSLSPSSSPDSSGAAPLAPVGTISFRVAELEDRVEALSGRFHIQYQLFSSQLEAARQLNGLEIADRVHDILSSRMALVDQEMYGRANDLMDDALNARLGYPFPHRGPDAPPFLPELQHTIRLTSEAALAAQEAIASFTADWGAQIRSVTSRLNRVEDQFSRFLSSNAHSIDENNAEVLRALSSVEEVMASILALLRSPLFAPSFPPSLLIPSSPAPATPPP
ncbi:uncharacterized protein C8Q71DRAFT_855593 [Rhodofomes roseus]|uniref:Uncharacterized protein n=1 Tax=Rhodofomes roseus TaxID=34475 RepID=A0ABQ8KQ39_9APHY|nr:uncharacterized protein C8Q71DRAFT_855593 [Rhodofomes roseus]KAH9840308.1 hypothetical protein C8Q71DRAFT_855593 [Rhodofomes roseus]